MKGSRYFRNINREYLKDKINEHARNSKNKNIREQIDLRRVTKFKIT
jgi:hypothetical protein